MGLAEEVIAVWGKEKVQRASPESVATLNIPASSKDFLVKVGLPREEVLVIRFELERNPFATLTEHARAKKLPSPKQSEKLRVLAYGNCAPDLCIDEGAGGRVIEIDLEGRVPTRLVNSGVEQLGAFLLAFARSKVREDMSDEENAQYVRRLKADLLKVDPQALSSPDHWWPQVLEQMESGLL
jgi:hypothetical protein